MPLGLDPMDIERLTDICRRFRINLVVLFGSRAKGWGDQESDYDIGVWIENCPLDPDPKKEGAIWEAFAELLGTDNRADGALSYEIASHGIPLYEGIPFAFHKFQVLTTKRCEDMNS